MSVMLKILKRPSIRSCRLIASATSPVGSRNSMNLSHHNQLIMTDCVSSSPYSTMSSKKSRTVFRPSFGDTDFAKLEEEEVLVEKPRVKPMPKMNMRRKRTLNTFDKAILVMIGKYKSISDVPDKIILQDGIKKNKEVEAEMKHLFLGSVFKYVYFFEYLSFFVTFSLLGFALYWYKRYQKEEDEGSSHSIDDEAKSS